MADVQEKDRYDIVLVNPLFGGKERKEVQHNFSVKTSETAFLFLQRFIKLLRAGGRAAIVIKNTLLSNSDNASRALRKELLESCNLHTILDCPQGTFLGTGVKTVVLFFEKGAPTRKVWYYQLVPGRSPGKTNPLNDDDLAEFVTLQQTFAGSEQSWTVEVDDIDTASWDLTVKNPNAPEEAPLRDPEEILNEIAALDEETAGILETIRGDAVNDDRANNRHSRAVPAPRFRGGRHCAGMTELNAGMTGMSWHWTRRPPGFWKRSGGCCDKWVGLQTALRSGAHHQGRQSPKLHLQQRG